VITRIEAHNYRCFPRFAVDLDRYHVLAGANGAGKTTLRRLGFWSEGSAKPPRPKEALDYLRQRHKIRAFNADFGKLAAMSVRQCQDAAFIQLRDYLRAWFPEQP
jgi:AAA15 family ATPase/GTPase